MSFEFKFNAAEVTSAKALSLPAFLFPEFPKAAQEYATEMARMKSEPRDSLFTLLMLVAPPLWMSGSWGNVEGGWRDSRSGLTLTFAAADRLIALRCEELGLDESLVRAYPASHSSLEESQHFYRLPFEAQMQRFVRRAV